MKKFFLFVLFSFQGKLFVHRGLQVVIALVADLNRDVIFANDNTLVDFWTTATVVEFTVKDQRPVWINCRRFKPGLISRQKKCVSGNTGVRSRRACSVLGLCQHCSELSNRRMPLLR